MGSHLVVLSDRGVAAELVERRSAIYSDRVCKPFDTRFRTFALTRPTNHQPSLPMVNELYELLNFSVTSPVNDLFQDGMFPVLLHDALREYLACPSQVISPLF